MRNRRDHPARTLTRDLARYCRLAREAGACYAVATSPRTVKTAHWVRLKCQFGCDGWGEHLTCPPYAPTPDQTARVLAEYRAAVFYAFRFTTPAEERRILPQSKRLIGLLERTAFLDGHYQALGLGSGPCRVCRRCDTSRPCRFPERARPSMEACGIDVYATARRNGYPLRVVRSRDDCGSYCSLLLVE